MPGSADRKVDGFATEPHYANHMAAVWLALPPERRGVFYVASHLLDAAAAEGIADAEAGFPPPGVDRPVLVAGFKDEQDIRGRSIIYLEHGAGQTYCGVPSEPSCGDPCYSGSFRHDRCILFLCPNKTVAARWNEVYPLTPTAVVGAPKLDHLIGRRDQAAKATVAISFHSEIRLCPETLSAFDHYAPHMANVVAGLRANGLEVLGHGHPRLWRRASALWQTLDVEPVPDFNEVLARAGVYCVDNSSTLYEFAACVGPTVALNAPWFRKDVHHGLRFWNMIPGPQVDEPGQVVDAVLFALKDPPQLRDQRQRVVSLVYAHRDGTAAKAAADAILETIGE